MAESKTLGTRITELTHEQKIVFVLLVFFSVCVVGLGVLQIRTTMLAPFALSNDIPNNLKSQVNTIDALRLRDTDHDGLTDFDELYVYSTSPYLYDTFGYGMSDKEVVAKGLPLCPKGQDCSSPAGGGGAVPVVDASSTILGGEQNALGPAPDDLQTVLSDPKKIRALLLQSGVKPEILTSINDTQLMEMVREMISASTTVSGTDALNSLRALQNK